MPLSDTYNERILRARLQGLSLIRDFDELLYREFAEMLVRIVEDASTGRISPERAEQLARSIIQNMERLSDNLAGAFEAVRSRGMSGMASAHSAALTAVSREAGVLVQTSFADVPQLAVELMMRRRGLGLSVNFRTLMNRHITDVAGEVDKVLTSAVARGQSVRRTTHELATAMARNDPKLLDTLSNIGPAGGRTRRAIQEGVQLDEIDLKRAKELLTDARRISQTELNTALQEADNVAAMRSPVVGGCKWTLSSTHPRVDVCDMLAQQDLYGLGAGVYPPDKVPSHPHPYDQCYTEKVIRPPEEWNNPKPDYGAPTFRDPEADERFFRELNPEITDNAIKRHRNRAREMALLAHQVSEEI